jgi:hypothetical protein
MAGMALYSQRSLRKALFLVGWLKILLQVPRITWRPSITNKLDLTQVSQMAEKLSKEVSHSILTQILHIEWSQISSPFMPSSVTNEWVTKLKKLFVIIRLS